MAACALIADTDGAVASSNRNGLDLILATFPKGNTLTPYDGIELFHKFVDSVRSDPTKGRQCIFEAIRNGARDRASAMQIMQLAIMMAAADEHISEGDHKAIDEVAISLGIKPPRHLSWVA